MAKTLHVDVETVRRRVSRMERLGAIEGWAIMPNPHLLEKECMVLYFETSDDSKKRDLTGILGHTEGITSVHSFHGGSLLVLLEYPKEIPAETQIAQMETLCGTQATMAWTMRFPPFGLTMTPTDWLILHSLRKEPRRRLSEIAQEVGISLRTLNRRMERLVEGDAFFLETLVNFQRIGRFSFTLLVSYAMQEKKRSLDDLVLRKLWRFCEGSDTSSSLRHSVFSLFSDNLTEAKQTYEWVKGLEGVSDARMGIHEGRRLLSSWIDNETEARNPESGSVAPRLKVRASRPEHSYRIPKRTPKGSEMEDSWWSGSFVEGRRVKVMLDRDICMGSASCVEIAPKMFQLDREKKKSVFDPAPLRILKDRSTNLDTVFLAAQSCPYRVIKLEDVDTGEQLFP